MAEEHFEVLPVHTGARVRLDEYRCHWHDPAPHDGGLALHYSVLFPQRGSFVKHWRGRDIVGDASTAVFHVPDEPYRVSHPWGCGDRGALLQFDETLAREIVLAFDPRAADLPASSFLGSHARTTAQSHALLRALARAKFAGESDPLMCEEASLLVLGDVIARSTSADRPALRRARGATCREHDRVVIEAAGLLSARFHERLALADVADAVGVSPFHLCRVFRAATGETIHQRREALRLRASLERLEDPRSRILDIALDLGFSSQSHFGAAFARGFGLTPAAYRRFASRELIGGLSKNLRDARLRARHAV